MKPCPVCGHQMPTHYARLRPRVYCSLSCRGRGVARARSIDPIDDAAVDRLIHGEPVDSSITDRVEATRILTLRGFSADFIAHQLRVAERTVNRYRAVIRPTRKAA